jgi:DNA-binding NarL/FixJ family response regulator
MPDRGSVPGPSAEADGPFFMLSKRQCEVLTLAAQGCTDGEIARRLVVSEYTVRDHWSVARERLGAVNRCHAVAIALVAGLIRLDADLAKAV